MKSTAENPLPLSPEILHSMLRKGCPDLVNPLNDVGRMVRDAGLVKPWTHRPLTIFDVFYYDTPTVITPSEIRVSLSNTHGPMYSICTELCKKFDNSPRYIKAFWYIDTDESEMRMRMDGYEILHHQGHNISLLDSYRGESLAEIPLSDSAEERQSKCKQLDPIFGYNLIDIFSHNNLLLMTLKKPDQSEHVNITLPIALRSFNPEALKMIQPKVE